MDNTERTDNLQLLLDYLNLAVDQSRAVFEAWSINQHAYAVYQQRKNSFVVGSNGQSDTLERKAYGVSEIIKEEKTYKARRLKKWSPLFLFIAYCATTSLLSSRFTAMPRSTMVKYCLFVIPICLVLVFYGFPYLLKNAASKFKAHREEIMKNDRSTYIEAFDRQRLKALDRLNEAQNTLNYIMSRGPVKERYSNLAALCSIRFYLRSGICNRLEGEDGAYEKYMKDLDQHYFIEQMGEYSTQNLTILMYQDGLHKEISKAQEIIEAVNKEYDQAFSSGIDFSQMDEETISSLFFPIRSGYFGDRKRAEEMSKLTSDDFSKQFWINDKSQQH